MYFLPLPVLSIPVFFSLEFSVETEYSHTRPRLPDHNFPLTTFMLRRYVPSFSVYLIFYQKEIFNRILLKMEFGTRTHWLTEGVRCIRFYSSRTLPGKSESPCWILRRKSGDRFIFKNRKIMDDEIGQHTNILISVRHGRNDNGKKIQPVRKITDPF